MRACTASAIEISWTISSIQHKSTVPRGFSSPKRTGRPSSKICSFLFLTTLTRIAGSCLYWSVHSLLFRETACLKKLIDLRILFFFPLLLDNSALISTSVKGNGIVVHGTAIFLIMSTRTTITLLVKVCVGASSTEQSPLQCFTLSFEMSTNSRQKTFSVLH